MLYVYQAHTEIPNPLTIAKIKEEHHKIIKGPGTWSLRTTRIDGKARI